MRKTKKLTVSATAVALGVVMMSLSAQLQLFDLSVCALASLIIAFVYMEVGSPYTFLVWIATSLLMLWLFSGSVLWAQYLLLFGNYPIVKGYVERIRRRVLWWVLKLVYANIITVLLIFLIKLITGEPFFNVDSYLLIGGIYILLIAAFVLYDVFLTVLIRYYIRKIRPRINKLLK